MQGKWTMALTLPKLLNDGCVLQSGQTIHIWGWSDAGDTVMATLQEQSATAIVQPDGSWIVDFGPLDAGGPFAMKIRSSSGERLERDCYVGEVFLCSGQSNMELPMKWVHADYPQEWEHAADPLLRQYKVIPECDFTGPHTDHGRAAWYGCDAETLGDFSALAYFFGKRIRERFDVPVGLLNVSLGGSPIESWMDAAALEAFPEALAELGPYLGEGVAERRSADSIVARDHWYQALGYPVVGDAHHEWVPMNDWPCPKDKAEEPAGAVWRDITLPGWFAERGLDDFRGEMELKRTVELPVGVDAHDALLRLGTMNDADHTWVNGMLVGGRSNLYEPRDYSLDAGILHEGINEIRVRLVVERPGGRVTPDKPMILIVGGITYDLSGEWRYAVTAKVQEDCPFEDFVRWKPTGLYNAMLAPCFPYAVRAALWYQGESNTGESASRYADMLEAMIGLWRSEWKQDRLPFLVVQLPNCSIDCAEDDGWPLVREGQWEVACRIPDVATVVTLDAGEWNDLHPHDKRLIATRLYEAALDLVYGERCRSVPRADTVECGEGWLTVHTTWATYAGRPLQATDLSLTTLDGADPEGIVLFWNDAEKQRRAQAVIDGADIKVRIPARRPREVRYAWCNDLESGLICDDDGTLLPPFRIVLPDSPIC